MREPVLPLTSLAKVLPGGRRLFDGLTLTLEAGEHVAIRGESGAGKSTLLNIVAGLDTADSGEVRVAGTDLARLDEAGRTALRRDAIGFVFQAFHILPHLDLTRNVAFPLILQKQPRSSALMRAGAMLDAVGLGDRRSSFPRELSGGELQRVAIARALVHAPRLILADEPTGNLDADTAAQIIALLGRTVKERGAAMLLVTHSPLAAPPPIGSSCSHRMAWSPPMAETGATAYRWLIAGEFRAFPMRFVLAGLAIAIGVALAFAVHVINRSAAESFGQAVRSAAGGADLQVRGASALGFDEGLYPQLMAHSVVADASPVVQLRATIGDRGRPITLLGLDIFRTQTVSPSLVVRPRIARRSAGMRSTDLDAVLDPDALYLSRDAMAQTGLMVGDRIEVRANGRTYSFVVAGDLPGVPAGQGLAVLDIASAQWRFGRLGTLDRVDLKLEPGTALAEAKAQLSSVLSANTQLSDAETESRRGDALSRAYRVNLDMLALVALLTGGFLVYSAQSLAVTRRLRQFALLRTLGLQERALAGQLLGEGAVLGVVGALLGLAGGYAIAGMALRLVGGDLGAGYFGGATTTLAFAPEAAVLFFFVGVATALAGSYVPARRAARIAPALALKEAGHRLMIAMAVMVTSFRGAVDDWLKGFLSADVYVAAASNEPLFDADTQRRLAATPGVAGIAFSKGLAVTLDPELPPASLIVRPVTGAGYALPVIKRAAQPGEGVALWLSEPAARLYNAQPGDAFALPIGAGGGQVMGYVAGIWRDYARQQGAIVIDTRDYTALTGDAVRSEAAVELLLGASLAAVRAEILARLPPDIAGRVDFAEPAALRERALRLFDRSFAITYALEAIAILIGLAGVAATFSAQTVARTKEFGVMRHVGMSRGQIIAMLALEGALLGLVGMAAGLAVGIALSQILIHVINPQSFHWTMTTRLPGGLSLGVATALIGTAAAAAMIAGRQAVSRDAVRAVSEDW